MDFKIKVKTIEVVEKFEGEINNFTAGSSEKRQAFLHMEELNKYPFPSNYDYEQIRKEAMEVNFITDREDRFRDSSKMVMDL